MHQQIWVRFSAVLILVLSVSFQGKARDVPRPPPDDIVEQSQAPDPNEPPSNNGPFSGGSNTNLSLDFPSARTNAPPGDDGSGSNDENFARTTFTMNARQDDSCQENVSGLAIAVGHTTKCQWTSGSATVSPPTANSSLCLDKQNNLAKSKVCLGQVTCDGTLKANLQIACQAANGDCDDASRCLRDFVKISYASCKTLTDLDSTMQPFEKKGQK